MEHLFIECHHAGSFWEKFLKWWNTKFDTNLQLKKVDILFGIILRCVQFTLLNHCIIIAKQSLYTCRRLKIPPSFEFFLLKLKKIYRVEKLISVQNKQVSKFERKWKDVFNEWSGLKWYMYLNTRMIYSLRASFSDLKNMMWEFGLWYFIIVLIIIIITIDIFFFFNVYHIQTRKDGTNYFCVMYGICFVLFLCVWRWK